MAEELKQRSMSDKLLIDRKLLERLQERLDPHLDARDWGMLCDAFRAQVPNQAGEAVEVVAYGSTHGINPVLSRHALGSSGEQLSVYDIPLMTVAQHNRIMATAKPDAELVELLREVSYRLGLHKVWGGMEWAYHPIPPHTYLKLIERIDAKLASLST